MAKGRFLNRSISDSADLADLSWQARELFLMAIPHLDREGRLHAEPRRFRAMVCPLLEHHTKATIELALIEMAQIGMIQIYRDERDQPVASFPGFNASQPGLAWKKKESPSAFSDPPDHLPEPCPELLQPRVRSNSNKGSSKDSGPTPDLLRSNSDKGSSKDSGPTPDLLQSNSDKGSDKGSAQRKGREGKRREEKRARLTALQSDMDPRSVAMMDALMSYPHLPTTITAPKAARHFAERLLGQLKTPPPVEWLTAAINDAVTDLPESPTDEAARSKIRVFVRAARKPKDPPDQSRDSQIAQPGEVARLMAAARGQRA